MGSNLKTVAAPRESGLDILFIAQGAWGDFFRTRLVEAFPSEVRTLYAEPPLLWPPVSVSHLRKWRSRFTTTWLHQRCQNAWTLEPIKFLPNLNFRQMQILNTAILAWQLKALCRSTGVRPDVLWFCDPYWRDLTRHFPSALVVYDCFDDYDRYPGQSPRTRLRVRADEAALAGQAHLSIAISSQLLNELVKLTKTVYLLPIGLDSQHFCLKPDSPSESPAAMRSIPHPRVGVFARQNERLDTELLHHVAKDHPEWHLVFIGKIEQTSSQSFRREMDLLAIYPNVHMLGEQPYGELPGLLAALDVGLVPYILNEQTHALMPSKVINYLAAGLPVVSTAIRGSCECLPWVVIAQTQTEFVELVKQELSRDQRELKEQRIRFVERRDWRLLAQEITRVLVNHPSRYRVP